MDESVACPICGLQTANLGVLASHLVERAEASEVGHVMWLNRHATKHRTSAADLELLLAPALTGGGSSSDRIAR
jgi:hypothetical protein